MRIRGIRYGAGSLLLGLAFGFLGANWTTTGTSAETRRVKIGESTRVVNDVPPVSDQAYAGHSSNPTIRQPSVDLLLALMSNGGSPIDTGEMASFPLMPLHSAGLQAGQEDKPVEQTRKNIQVLKGLPESQLFIAMNFIRASLGVDCAYCHVYNGDDKWDWEKDDKPTKRTARRMMQMVFDINKANFNGEKRVTCYTCHRGQTEPVAMPPLPQSPPPEGAGASASEKPATPALPTVEQILNKYVEALGGKAAYKKLKSRVMKGSQIRFDGTAWPVEIYQASPNKYVSTIKTPNGLAYMGFNGAKGWVKNPRGQRDLSGSQLVQMKRAAEFYGDLKLNELYPNMTLIGKEKVGDREAYVIQSHVDEKRTERLYFDTQSGLLIRIIGLNETILGAIPDQTDFSDYREVDGIKLPFTIQMSYVDPWIGWTRKFTEIKHNVLVDETKFNPPPA